MKLRLYASGPPTLKQELELSCKIDMEFRVEAAQSLAESIRAKMDRLLASFKEDGIDARFNSLGEVQSDGVFLDRQLGELNAVRDLCRLVVRRIGKRT